MKLRNSHITIGLALMCWAGIFLLASSVFGQQTPTGANAHGRHARTFQDAVLEADDGATLYADDYSPAVKEAIFLPDGKSLTIVGGVFRPAGGLAAVWGANWAHRLTFVASVFVEPTDGSVPYAGWSLVTSADRLTLESCSVVGGVAGNDILLHDSYVDAGVRSALNCEWGGGIPAVTGYRTAVIGGVILGGRGATRGSECGCENLAAGGVGVFSTYTFLSESNPPLIVGGLGENGGPCGSGPQGAPVASIYTVVGG